jgi:hypothetical protein
MNVENNSLIVDHINGDKNDNRKENLRCCSANENLQNRRKARTNKSSRFKGVSYFKPTDKWKAEIKSNKNHVYIGLFLSEIAAANAYNFYAKELHGDFANFNDVPFMSKNEWENEKAVSA